MYGFRCSICRLAVKGWCHQLLFISATYLFCYLFRVFQLLYVMWPWWSHPAHAGLVCWSGSLPYRLRLSLSRPTFGCSTSRLADVCLLDSAKRLNCAYEIKQGLCCKYSVDVTTFGSSCLSPGSVKWIRQTKTEWCMCRHCVGGCIPLAWLPNHPRFALCLVESVSEVWNGNGCGYSSTVIWMPGTLVVCDCNSLLPRSERNLNSLVQEPLSTL